MSEERDILTIRKAKMQSWQAAVGTYPNEFRRQDLAADLLARHVEDDKAALAEAKVATAVAGRIMLRRVMGKASFIPCRTSQGKFNVIWRETMSAKTHMPVLPNTGRWGISLACAVF